MRALERKKQAIEAKENEQLEKKRQLEKLKEQVIDKEDNISSGTTILNILFCCFNFFKYCSQGTSKRGT